MNLDKHVDRCCARFSFPSPKTIATMSLIVQSARALPCANGTHRREAHNAMKIAVRPTSRETIKLRSGKREQETKTNRLRTRSNGHTRATRRGSDRRD